MTEHRARLGWQTRIALLLGLGTLLATGVLVARHQRSRHTVHVVVPTAPGVRDGTPVTYRGVTVGQVSRIAFVDSGVVLELAIDDVREVPLRRGDTLRTAANGLFGEQVVRIVPGVRSAPLLRAGDTLRGAPVDAVTTAATEALVEAFRREFFDSARWKRGSVSSGVVRLDSIAGSWQRSTPGALNAVALPVPVRVIPVPPGRAKTDTGRSAKVRPRR